jgi:putative spermidine/putrescine transport system permease protein
VLAAYAAVAGLFLLAPIAIIVLFSFSDGSTFVFPPRAFSLRWYRYLAGRDEFVSAALVSLRLAALSSILAAALGLPAALALVRERFPGKGLVESVLMGPLVLPGIILGVALLQYFTAIGLTRSFERLLLGHVIICLPLAIRSIAANLYGIDPSLEEASRTLGAGRWRTFRRVLLPLLRPGIAAALLFSFVTSFDNVVISIYLIGADTVTLPIRIFTWLEWQFDPSIAAISTVTLAVTAGFVAIAEIVARGSRKTIA